MHVTVQQLGGPAALSVYIGALAVVGFLLTCRGLPWWYQLLMGAAASLAVAGLWLTCLTDPGIIPASTDPDPIIQQLDAGLAVADGYMYSRDGRGAHWVRVSRPGGAAAGSKYCSTCHIWRPPRSHHCSTCNACMEHWDHHCSVVGNCIAGRNHRFFAGFLLAGQAACLLNLGGAIWRLQQRGLPTPGTWMGTESFLLIVAAVAYGYTATMLLFGTFHCLSIVCDITTKDLLTDRQLWRNAPCCPGTRSPSNLVRSWHILCCMSTTFRPWQRERQQQQQQQHVWRPLPVADEAELGGNGSSDSSRSAAHVQIESPSTAGPQHRVDQDVASDSASSVLLHRQQVQQGQHGHTVQVEVE